MKLRQCLFTFLCSTLLLTSCMEAVNNRRSLDSDETQQESTGNVIVDPTNASWYAKGQYVEGTISLNSSDTESIYLVGGIVNNYLVSQEKTQAAFCLVASIDNNEIGVAKKSQLRLKAIPVKSSKSQETSIRINISNAQDNRTFCNGDSIGSINSNGVYNTVDANEAAFSLSEICETCSEGFTTANLRLHESVGGEIGNTYVSPTSIDLSPLSIAINVTGDSTNPGATSCTNSKCQLQGYSCCLNNQCVVDGETRPGVDENSSEYKTALAEILENENAFKSYPDLFFVCPINVDPDDSDTGETDDELDNANQQLLEDIKDYKCLLGEIGECSPDLDTVRVKVWNKCGCPHEPTYAGGELQLDARCIDYKLKAEKDENDNILNIQCDIPTDQDNDKPFQNLSVLVSAKSSPHRYFALSGTPYDDLSEVPEGTNQEGDSFFYLDNANKAGPVETTYNMNAVIGPMTLDLQQAQPAKMIEVNVDQVYIISVTTGYATPCPYCQQDAWQKVFSSHPESSMGYGLTWRGYTTDRSAIGSNTTYGNYEDTIFGRACWVPPTMIPSSHINYSSAGVQRRNRLTTQAAMYVNGYQRDWYGFNQGALIGSFDGVSWFAIGAGRRVRSTTKKLFIAINAPFADLAQNSNYTVSVIEDLGGQNAADHDYDFTLPPDGIGQNFGASCQYMHSCNTDSECVAKLGWEYTCGQVTDVKTNWPKFDIDAFEKNDYSREGISLSSILSGNISSGQNKRCVYRGAGAPCKLNPNDNVKKTSQSKLLTCAPNFYCAALDSASFSKELIRSPNEPTAILYGQAASVLGRPLNYANRSEELPTEVKNAIAANLSIYAATGSYGPSDVGLCIPGRSAKAEYFGPEGFELRHQEADANNRTDYISQIASCSENASTTGKVRACPVFDEDGNYFNDETTTRNPLAVIQNMCSSSSIDPITNESSFKSIEAEPLTDILSIPSETLAANACLRRAGAICHTDLDCGPNRLHADIARGLSPSSFGGTMAEQKYWEEELVCGQSEEEPLLNTILGANYYNYDMSKNRCCREISKDFTMYTAVNGSNLPGYHIENEDLGTWPNPIQDNAETGRYSRYLSAKSRFGNPTVSPDTIPSTNDTKVFNETGRSTCCGGGFIRKFEDGTNNWTVGNRLNLSPSKLACMNYSMRSWEEGLKNQSNWLMEYSYMGSIGGYRNHTSPSLPFVWIRPGDPIGSIQANIQEDSVDTPQAINTNATIEGNISLYPADENGTLYNTKIPFGLYELMGHNETFNAPYPPVIVKPTGFNNPIAPAVGGDELDHRTLAIYLPDYIDNASIITLDKVFLNYITDPDASDLSDLSTIDQKKAVNKTCTSLTNAYTELADTQPGFCILSEGGFDYLLFRINSEVTSVDGMEIGWFSFGYNIVDDAFGTIPGGQEYYEDIFEKYELLGIPQISYEAIRCNDEKSDPTDGTSDLGRLVDGIYNETTDPFTTDAIVNAGTLDAKVFYKTDGSTISLPQIFSADEFKCCSKLGSSVSDPSSMCCSGFGVLNADNSYECRLPSGTDINLYLNLFISSEGIVTDNADMSLDPDADYDLTTGYPDHTDQNVLSKVQQIGQRFCQLGTTRNGSAFGKFYPQPSAGYFTEDNQLTNYNTIVDSMNDITSEDANYSRFISGFRWNRHIYCE